MLEEEMLMRLRTAEATRISERRKVAPNTDYSLFKFSNAVRGACNWNRSWRGQKQRNVDIRPARLFLVLTKKPNYCYDT